MIYVLETNVSVYLKRGIFDDDIADDFSWRRAGHLPIAGHINEDNCMYSLLDNAILFVYCIDKRK